MLVSSGFAPAVVAVVGYAAMQPGAPTETATRLRVFVTGATGFVGAHVVRALSDAGHAVTMLARDPHRTTALCALPGVSAVLGRLEDPAPWHAALAGHDACIHLALLWPDDPADDLRLADLHASTQLFVRAAEAGIAHFVYTSSTAVFQPHTGTVDAQTPVRSADFYGATKASAEVFLSAVCHQGAMRGNVIRPGAVLGGPGVPGARVRVDRRVVAMVEAARRGETIRTVRGEGRQWIGAEALAGLYVALLAYPGNHARFVAVAPEVLAWREIAEAVVARVGKGRLEVVEAEVARSAVFDPGETVGALGPIASPRPALHAALRALCVG